MVICLTIATKSYEMDTKTKKNRGDGIPITPHFHVNNYV